MTQNRRARFSVAVFVLSLTVALSMACEDDSGSAESSSVGPSAGAAMDDESGGSGSEDQPERDASGDESQRDREATESDASESTADEGPLKGHIKPGDVTEGSERWRRAVEEATVDEEALSALADVEEGAQVTIYLGAWCPDSRREVSHFWAALEKLDDVPFDVGYVALDRNFDAGEVSLEGRDINFVPTFVVERGGEEVGRVVESAPDGIVRELARLLGGETEGVVSGRDDL